MSNSELKKALELIQQGEKSQARMILNSVLRQNPKNVNAWLLVTAVARNDEEKRKAAKNVLKLQPGHPKAQKILRGLDQKETARKNETPDKPRQTPSKTVGDLMSEPKRKPAPALSGIHSFDDDDDIFDFDKPSADDDVFNFGEPNEYDTLFGSDSSHTPPRKTSATVKKSSSNALVFVGLGFVAVLAIGIIAAGVAMVSQNGGFSSGNTIQQTVSMRAGDTEDFVVRVSGLYQITARGDDEFDPVIEVFDEGGDLLAYNDDNFGVRGLDTYDAFVEVVRINGYARIQISDFWGEGGSADVTIVPFTGISSFHDLDIGDSVTLDIDDARWIELEVGSERELTITVASADGDVDPILEIYDENFHLIARNDDHNTNLDLDTYDSALEDIDLSGTIYLHVVDFIGNTQGDVTISVK